MKILLLLKIVVIVQGFYSPESFPVNFCEKADSSKTCPNEIPLFVNKLDSDQSVIPYEYHDFDFCTTNEEDPLAENLGQILFGGRIRSSPYKINFKEERQCTILCEKEYKKGDAEHKHRLRFLQQGMKLNYQHHWIIDNMPVSENANPQAIGATDEDGKIIYTYSVYWKNTSMKWSSRWDYLLDSVRYSDIQRFSIRISSMIVVILSGMIRVILMRTLHRDITRYNQLENEEDAQEEFGWKLVHGDVFCPPRSALFLSVFIGTGSQLLCCSFITLAVAFFDFLSPATRGSLINFVFVWYILLSIVAGYISARLYKTMEGLDWKKNALLTAFFVPGILFGMFFINNLVLWFKGSSAAVPFGTFLILLSILLFVFTPLTFIGAFVGSKTDRMTPSMETSQVPRQVPKQTHIKLLLGMLLSGILPFGCIFTQLSFILNSIWAHQIYYMFGFLSLVFVLLVIICSETTVLMTYFYFRSGDYNWWWRSFLTSGLGAAYLFMYCIYYFTSELTITGTISTILYFAYTGIFAFLFFLATGTIGFFATYFFVHKAHASLTTPSEVQKRAELVLHCKSAFMSVQPLEEKK
ncbi:hypothetical protein FO519_008716 [Halicephalobus sp. NKZ332]|nr:hypothetical protein FO519_008716 [Halicephalobus sp. NKZ332]